MLSRLGLNGSSADAETILELNRLPSPIKIREIFPSLYGKIVRLEDPELNSSLILKLFVLPMNDEAKDLFENEAEFRIDLNGVIKILTTCRVVFPKKMIYRSSSKKLVRTRSIISRYIPGVTLETFKTSWNEESLIPLFHQVIKVVASLHQRNIAHRDIKPDNIIYNSETRSITLIDLGFATDRDLNRGLRGTPIYLSPEIYKLMERGPPVNGRTKLDSQLTIFSLDLLKLSDVWAVGILFFFLIYGDEPFAGSDSEEIATNVLKNRIQKFPEFPRLGFDRIHYLIDLCLQPISIRKSAREISVVAESLV